MRNRFRLSQERRVELEFCLLVLGAAAVVYLSIAWSSTGNEAQKSSVVLPAGATQGVSDSLGSTFHLFHAAGPGTLAGSFVVNGNDQVAVFVCNSTEFGVSSQYGPAGYRYSSGWTTSGNVSVYLTIPGDYWVGPWPEPGNYTNHNPINATLVWTSDLVLR